MYNIGYFDKRFTSIWIGPSINPLTGLTYEKSVCFDPKLGKAKNIVFKRHLDNILTEVHETIVIGNNVDIFDPRSFDFANAVSLLEHLFARTIECDLVIITGSHKVACDEVLDLLKLRSNFKVIFRIQALGTLESNTYGNLSLPCELKQAMDKVASVARVEAILGPFLPAPSEDHTICLLKQFEVLAVDHLYITCYGHTELEEISQKLLKRSPLVDHLNYLDWSDLHDAAKDYFTWEEYALRYRDVIRSCLRELGIVDEKITDCIPID